ncbi:hypothetical protein CC78DRAFT_528638 [Lojkania enalia]|uniref:Uncharacterized protein n=1 Tax=Lojkania enalia TaxID=147567 RepID=A0A9P4NBD8_9PLEO|nr:hypothetical protein CC78DRAFT_528638 [Didymosphaeria enalia]
MVVWVCFVSLPRLLIAVVTEDDPGNAIAACGHTLSLSFAIERSRDGVAIRDEAQLQIDKSDEEPFNDLSDNFKCLLGMRKLQSDAESEKADVFLWY